MRNLIVKSNRVVALVALVIPFIQVHAENCTGFCFPEGGAKMGGGTFEQYVPPRGVIDVPGDIPAGIKNLYVELNADDVSVDIDIQLYDIDNNQPLVGWNIGALIDSGSRASADYNGVSLEYSGYNGVVCGDRGHEYIKITGTTKNKLRMRMYGYKEGHAKVTYSYEGTQSSGIDAGKGSFQQQVPYRGIVEVPGDIPVGIKNLSIKLDSPVDVDIQLFDADANKPLVGWRIGALIDSSIPKSKQYNSVTIEYSGYDGDGAGKGNEYINITGVTRNSLKMKMYGYQAGTATVHYSWEAN